MKKLVPLVLVIAVAAGVAYLLVREGVVGGAGAVGDDTRSEAVAALDADEIFVRIQRLRASVDGLESAGSAALASSLAGYCDRAVEALERGDLEEAAEITAQGEVLERQAVGEPVTTPASTASSSAGEGAPAPSPGGGASAGGSVLTEQATVVDMIGTIHGGNTQPNIRGARTKARDAASAAEAASRRTTLDDEDLVD